MAATGLRSVHAIRPAPALGGSGVESARKALTGNTFDTHVGLDRNRVVKASSRPPVDFSSDVGRKQFGFSHEEIDDSAAYYEGQFKLFQRSGQGVLHCPELGSKYQGEFESDRAHGEGQQVWPDGSQYAGEWRRGQKHGAGRYVSADGLEYVGQWERGRRHGEGHQTYANGDTYNGGWHFGVCAGPGTYNFSEGARYEGFWVCGRYEGPGVLYSPDGARERRWYSGGTLNKREVLPDGPPPQPGCRRDIFAANVVSDQARRDVEAPTRLPLLAPSRFLICRESAGMDLSAPPLKRRAPAVT